jgi:hypothetical protein
MRRRMEETALSTSEQPPTRPGTQPATHENGLRGWTRARPEGRAHMIWGRASARSAFVFEAATHAAFAAPARMKIGSSSGLRTTALPHPGTLAPQPPIPGPYFQSAKVEGEPSVAADPELGREYCSG